MIKEFDDQTKSDDLDDIVEFQGSKKKNTAFENCRNHVLR
jgi:hypothetical protein